MPIQIAFVMFGDEERVSFPSLQKSLHASWPNLPSPTEHDQTETTIAFRIGDLDVILGHMPAPIPWSDLEGPCSSSILWKNAKVEVKKHKSHYIVTVQGEADAIELCTLLTKVTAAILSTTNALGVYWGSATLVIPRKIFVEFTKKVLPQGYPLDIWVDFRVGRVGQKKTSGFTTGMSAFGHREFETVECPETPLDLRARFQALANYVLENGPVIKDGDTIGEDANERIRVVLAKSQFGNKKKVLQLQYLQPNPKKPWWRLW